MSGCKYLVLALVLFSILPFIDSLAVFDVPCIGVSDDGMSQVETTETYTPHDPIVIDGNDDFVSQGWPGSGTVSDPYVIEGLNITYSLTCITVRNTDAHFEIRHCLIISSVKLGNAAIYFDNVTHGTIKNNIIAMHGSGVYLGQCANCTLVGNNIKDIDYGVVDMRSFNTLIQLNVITNSGFYGIYEYQSMNANIIKNHIEDTYLGAIQVEFSNYTNVCDNTLINQGRDAIRLCAGATNQLVQDNIIEGAGWNGICSENPHTVIRNNTISATTWPGIRLEGAPYNVIEHNEVSFSGEHGIRIEDSDSSVINDNTIVNSSWCGLSNRAWNVSIARNRVYNSSHTGIRTTYTADSSIVANFVEITGDYGIESWSSPDVRVLNNTLVRTGGIVFENSSYGGHIYGNSLYDTFWTGLRARESKYCIFEYNELNGVVEDGILIHDLSDGAIVRGNTFNDAGWQGLSVFNSSDCIFMNNEVNNIDDNGVLVLRAPNTTVHENIISDVGASGIALDASDGSLIMRNVVLRAGTHGINAVNAKDVDLFENTINVASLRGINIETCRRFVVHGNIVNRTLAYDIALEYSFDCLVFLNAFLTQNNYEAKMVLNFDIKWNNATHGNYWERYDGIDENGDGIGDTPYQIHADNTDFYPLVLLSFFEVLSKAEYGEIVLMSMSCAPEFPKSTDSVMVNVTVNRPDFVYRVILTYSTDNGITWTNTTASQLGNNWVAEIPAQSFGTLVRYKAIIRDKFGDWMMTSENSYRVTGQDMPVNIDPVTLSVAIVGIAVIAAGYMVYRGRRMRAYARYEKYFD